MLASLVFQNRTLPAATRQLQLWRKAATCLEITSCYKHPSGESQQHRFNLSFFTAARLRVEGWRKTGGTGSTAKPQPPWNVTISALDSSLSAIMQYSSFCAWFISQNMISSVIHIVINDRIPSSQLTSTPLGKVPYFLPPSSVVTYTVSVSSLQRMVLNTDRQMWIRHTAFIFFGYNTQEWDHVVDTHLVFEEPFSVFQYYFTFTPTVQGLPFLHIRSDTYLQFLVCLNLPDG